MIIKNLAALTLVAPLLLVSLTGFAGDEVEEVKEDSTQTEMLIKLEGLFVESDQNDTLNDDNTEEVPVEGNKRVEILSENDTEETVVDEDSDNKDS